MDSVTIYGNLNIRFLYTRGILSWWCFYSEDNDATKIIRIHPLGTMSIYVKFNAIWPLTVWRLRSVGLINRVINQQSITILRACHQQDKNNDLWNKFHVYNNK